MALKRNIFVLGYVDLVLVAERQSLTTSVAIAGELSFNHLYLAVPNRRFAGSNANCQRFVDILKYRTTVMVTNARAQNVLSSSKSYVYAGRKPLRTNRAGYLTSVVARYAEESSVVALIYVESHAIDQENVKTQGSLVSSSVEKPRNLAVIHAKRSAMHHRHQEAKCNASKTSEGGSKKALKCDDECARLERNRRLALALDIDSQTHTNTHIPYSTITIQLYLKSTKWAQTQEREFRVFAADEAEKRLRFKPMPSSQRAFIHSLAEDFGFDSESMDPEPHRHILILKTPRFVMAPMKTLMECVRIVRTQANEAASSVINEGQSRHQASYEPFNGYVLTNPRFALTLDELRSDFAEILATVATLTFNISLLPSEEIVLRAHSASSTTTISAASTEALLKSIKPALASVTTTKRLAVSIHLCTLDSSLNLLRQESDGANTDGWSQVAAKGAVGPRFAPKKLALGTKSSFTILGSKVVDAKKKKEDKHKEEESVIEDWEEEFRREEELVLAAEKVEPDSKALSASKHATGEETKASTLSDLKDATDDEPRGKLTASVAALN
ncbi:FKBP12-associated protein [Lambiella insularis]|nr:FKBP12-associated protein [Lambiella insularis]